VEYHHFMCYSIPVFSHYSTVQYNCNYQDTGNPNRQLSRSGLGPSGNFVEFYKTNMPGNYQLLE
jgi:hypothetical protein